MARKNQRLNVIRLAVAKALFFLGGVAIVAGSWAAFESWQFASGLIGGIILFALADLVAPIPDEHHRRPPNRPNLGH
jgi:hypothetical protein